MAPVGGDDDERHLLGDVSDLGNAFHIDHHAVVDVVPKPAEHPFPYLDEDLAVIGGDLIQIFPWTSSRSAFNFFSSTFRRAFSITWAHWEAMMATSRASSLVNSASCLLKMLMMPISRPFNSRGTDSTDFSDWSCVSAPANRSSVARSFTNSGLRFLNIQPVS